MRACRLVNSLSQIVLHDQERSELEVGGRLSHLAYYVLVARILTQGLPSVCLVRVLAHRLALHTELLALRSQNHLLAFSFGHSCAGMDYFGDEGIVSLPHP